MKKKILITIGVIVGILAVIIGGVVIKYWPFISSVDWSIVSWSNVKALYMAFTEDEESLNEKMKEIDNKRSEEIKEYVDIEIRDYTEEELKQIESGEKTKTEIIAQIITEKVNEKATENIEENVTTREEVVTGQEDEKKPQSGAASGEEKPKTETADEIIARHIAKLYEYHGQFEGRVASLASNAHNWLHAYKASNPDVSWRDAKVATMQHYMNTATKIESECYAMVDAEIASLKADLKAIGADTSIVATIKESAYNEMDARKAKIVQEGTTKMNTNN